MIALLLAACLQDAKEAEALVRKAEEKLAGAKTVKISLTLENGDRKLRTLLTTADANRLLWAGDTGRMVCDGRKLDHGGEPVEAPADLNACLWLVLLRAHPMLMQSVTSERPSIGDLRKQITCSDYKTAGKEKVGDRSAVVVEFKSVSKTAGDPKGVACVVRLWIDSETGLPLKRSVSAPLLRESLSETYESIKLDEKVDDAIFKLDR